MSISGSDQNELSDDKEGGKPVREQPFMGRRHSHCPPKLGVEQQALPEVEVVVPGMRQMQEQQRGKPKVRSHSQNRLFYGKPGKAPKQTSNVEEGKDGGDPNSDVEIDFQELPRRPKMHSQFKVFGEMN